LLAHWQPALWFCLTRILRQPRSQQWSTVGSPWAFADCIGANWLRIEGTPSGVLTVPDLYLIIAVELPMVCFAVRLSGKKSFVSLSLPVTR
jgi:hypothetical protein